MIPRSERAGSDQPPSRAWHALPADRVLELLESGVGGLAGGEAERRLREGEANTLETARPLSPWRLLTDQLRSLVVLLLVVAAALAVALGDYLEGASIGAVLLVNVVIGFWTEWRARRAMEALSRLQVPEAVVVRDGTERKVDARTLVPGDVVALEAGSAVPADGRILESTELRIREAPLTGESEAVTKTARALDREGAATIPLADRASMAYMGTTVVAGEGRIVVTGTGASTELGRVSELVMGMGEQPTPLERRLDDLGRRLIWGTLAVAGLVTAAGALRGRDLWLMVETGIALAIAAVPEGLPVVATVALALGMRRMARRNALIRRLHAVEALGSATVICADKTGTLTSGRMTATALWVGGRRIPVEPGPGGKPDREDPAAQPSGGGLPAGAVEAVRIGVLANRASLSEDDDALGDPTDAALLRLGARSGLVREVLLARTPEVGAVPFSSSRMWMATFHRIPRGDGVEVVAKGAASALLPRCSRYVAADGREEVLTEEAAERVRAAEDALASEGLRVLALARGRPAGGGPGPESVGDLTLVGLVGMMDPPAPDVSETVGRLRGAGIRTLMITGDQAPTARAVGLKVGILDEAGVPAHQILDGGALAALSPPELEKRVERVRIFARVSAEDKLRIVEALQRGGEVVGMLGDGVNDAPALKKAEIGVAMGGRGTDVAREAADLILSDDRFSTVGVAVEEGRVIFDNIRKFIFYLFSCNVSEVGVIFLASVTGLPLPLLPLQLLWLNLITDVFPALALAVEAPEPDVMDRPPRDPEAALLSRDFVTVVLIHSGLITAVTLGVFSWLLLVGTGTREAVTVSFMTLALAQLFHVFNARSIGPLRAGRELLTNGWLWGAVGLTVVLQLLAVYLPPMARILDTVPLSPERWALVLPAALAPLAAGQAWKRLLVRRRGG